MSVKINVINKNYEKNLENLTLYNQEIIKSHLDTLLQNNVTYLYSQKNLDQYKIEQAFNNLVDKKTIVYLISEFDEDMDAFILNFVHFVENITKNKGIRKKLNTLEGYTNVKLYKRNKEKIIEKNMLMTFNVLKGLGLIVILICFFMSEEIIGAITLFFEAFLIYFSGAVSKQVSRKTTHKENELKHIEITANKLNLEFVKVIDALSKKKYKILFIFKAVHNNNNLYEEKLMQFKQIILHHLCPTIILGNTIMIKKIKEIIKIKLLYIHLLNHSYVKEIINNNFDKNQIKSNNSLIDLYINYLLVESSYEPIKVYKSLLSNIKKNKLEILEHEVLTKHFKEVSQIVNDNLLEYFGSIEMNEEQEFIIKHLYGRLFLFNEKVKSFSKTDFEINNRYLYESYNLIIKKVIKDLIKRNYINITNNGKYIWNHKKQISIFRIDNNLIRRRRTSNNYFQYLEEIVINIIKIEKGEDNQIHKNPVINNLSVWKDIGIIDDKKLLNYINIIKMIKNETHYFLLQMNISKLFNDLAVEYIKYIIKSFTDLKFIESENRIIDLKYEYESSYIKIGFQYFFSKDEFDAEKLNNTLAESLYKVEDYYILILLYLKDYSIIIKSNIFNNVNITDNFSLINLSKFFEGLNHQLNLILKKIKEDKRNYKGGNQKDTFKEKRKILEEQINYSLGVKL